MTATNHALTGAAIALSVKSPVLAIPLAFISHFLLDAIPHYNPPKINKRTFVNFTIGWGKKFQNRFFRTIFFSDMLLLLFVFASFLFALNTNVSSWAIGLSMLAAIAPDFLGGRYLIYYWLNIKVQHEEQNRFLSRFHIWVQWMERPWGIWVELAWFITMGMLILIRR